MVLVIYTLYGFAIFFFIFWSVIWLLHIIAICYGKYKLHKKVKSLPGDEVYPGVSILKPLMGTDPHLMSNLETFFTMRYSLFELLFCIEDEKDPSIDVVNNLINKYPNITAKLFIGGSSVGVNPKINNMHRAYEESKYDLILISDSGIRMKEDTLQDMVDHMTEKIGIVHQMPFTCDRNSFAATYEKIYFGTAQSRMYLAADCVRVNCHTGMSTLMRKSVLTEVGGIKTFGCYLAEDFFIAKTFIDKGWRIGISSQPAMQNSGVCEIHQFQARLTRWAKLRIAMLPLIIIFEPLSECIVLGACAGWAVHYLFKWEPLVFFLVHVLVWLICDWILLSIVQNSSLPFSKFSFIVGWLFREVSGPYLFILAAFDPSIRWRDRCFRLSWGGIAQEINIRKC